MTKIKKGVEQYASLLLFIAGYTTHVIVFILIAICYTLKGGSMIKQTKQKLNDLILAFKAEVAENINAVRVNNPDINVISNAPRVFTISSRNVSDVLDPMYYDYDAQFDYLLDKLNKQSVDSFCNTITKLVDTGKLDGRRFHPVVIEKIKLL